MTDKPPRMTPTANRILRKLKGIEVLVVVTPKQRMRIEVPHAKMNDFLVHLQGWNQVCRAAGGSFFNSRYLKVLGASKVTIRKNKTGKIGRATHSFFFNESTDNAQPL